ncbi:hypothetical protein KSP40_PGU012144 [Platanthera guangdongensis]|uniref:Uncharacterized protein n=1 Tax=Platanthera guangdongensis TaxID=2320717 RepID=A0ABR2M315_9ASPA
MGPTFQTSAFETDLEHDDREFHSNPPHRSGDDDDERRRVAAGLECLLPALEEISAGIERGCCRWAWWSLSPALHWTFFGVERHGVDSVHEAQLTEKHTEIRRKKYSEPERQRPVVITAQSTTY